MDCVPLFNYRSTVLAIADDLTKDGLVLRYRVEGTDTGSTATCDTRPTAAVR